MIALVFQHPIFSCIFLVLVGGAVESAIHAARKPRG